MPKKGPRVSVKAVIVKNDRLLLIRKKGSDGKEYFVLPGGGQEHGESLIEAVVREVQEETGYSAKPKDILFVRDSISTRHENAAQAKHRHQVEVFFEATLAGSKPVPATHPDPGQVAVDWIPLKVLSKLRVFPSFLRRLQASKKSKKIYLGAVN